MNPSQVSDLPLNIFNEIFNVQDFIKSLNQAFFVLYKKDSKPFNVRVINYYAFHSINRYTSFDVRKKSGGRRKIDAPVPYLKLIQRCTNLLLQGQFSPHHASHGFLLRRSIVTNAGKHVGKKYVLNIDLENFFGSIEFRRIKTVLGLSPFNLVNEKESIAFLISNLCCHDGVLPQGSPCSPLLTNIVCQRLDRKLLQLAKNYNANYTRYADDISMSSDRSIFNEELFVKIRRIIIDEGFVLNESKTRIQSNEQRQVVTGITVNKRINIDRQFIREVRSILFNCETYGLDFAQGVFEKHWRNLNMTAPSVINSLGGKIEFLGMVRGRNDVIYRKYKKKFLDLSEGTIDFSFVTNPKVRLQLELDHKRMKKIKNDLDLNSDEKFIDYCVSAFLQIEEIINYYYDSIMSYEKLCDELVQKTLLKRNKIRPNANIGGIDMVYKLYLFEKEFYYLPGVYYDSILTKIRQARNHGMHRSSTVVKDNQKMQNDFDQLQLKKKSFTANGTNYILNPAEKYIEDSVKLTPFLKSQDFTAVKEAVIDLVSKIKIDLSKK